jgi:hypothetical protein
MEKVGNEDEGQTTFSSSQEEAYQFWGEVGPDPPAEASLDISSLLAFT